jgi:hypothetical protein
MKTVRRFGGRPQTLRDRIPVLISFERDRYKEFEQQCIEGKISVSEGVRRLLEQELEKKAEGEVNPLNIIYHKQAEKPLQTDLTQWIQMVHENKDNTQMLIKIENISKACANTARSYIKQGSWRLMK